MTSAGHKNPSRKKEEATGGTTTRMVGWGKIFNYQFGVGWRRGDHLKVYEPSPLGMVVQNVQQANIGYGQVVGVLANGKVETWGLNNGQTLPWAAGPEGLWTGVWQYRTGLKEQVTLETTGAKLSRETVETKERKLEFAERELDKRKGVVGQVVYIKGHIVTYEGKTWEALKENCATPPGSDATAWAETSPQVVQFKKPTKEETEVWFPYAYNLLLPTRSPQMAKVKAVSMIGAHGLALLSDGTVRQWGRVIGYGGGGTNFNGSYGPKPRPLRSPPKKRNTFHGRMVKGSKWIDNLENIGEKHNKTSGSTTSFGQATKEGSTILMPEGVTGITEIKNGTLTTGITGGTEPQTLAVTGIEHTMIKGGSVELRRGTETQIFGIREEVLAGAAQIIIAPVIAKHTFPAGATEVVKLATLAKAETEEVLNEGVPYSPPREKVLRIEMSDAALADYASGNKIEIKKPPKEQVFWAVQEGPAQSAGWPVVPKLPEGAKAVAVASSTKGGGYTFCLVLTEAGEVLAWGTNINGQMGRSDVEVGKENVQLEPKYVRNPADSANLKEIVAIAAGETFCLALASDKKVYVWGQVDHSLGGKKVSEEGTLHTALPIPMEGLSATAGKKPVAIAGAESTAYVITEEGKVFAWGNNEKGECGNGSLGGKENKRWKSGTTYALNAKVAWLGANYKNILGLKSETPPGEDATHWEFTSQPSQPVPAQIATVPAEVNYIAGGRNHAAAVTSAGALYTWGSNGYGQIGNGLSGKGDGAPDVPTPFHVPLESKKVLSCDCGEWDTIAILEGETTLPNPLRVKLIPTGSIGGEQSATLRLEWACTGANTTGWEFKYRRAPTWWEEAEITAEIERIEEALEEEGIEKELKEELEEELEEFELVQEEGTEAAKKLTPFVPTEVSANNFRYDWTPPSAMTLNLGFTVALARTASEPTNWREISIATNGLWNSSYAF